MRSDRAPVKSGLIRNKKGGYEWKNHKYIDKVKTKSGKIRYIYEDDDGELVDVTADELQKIVRDQRNKEWEKQEHDKIKTEFQTAVYNIDSAMRGLGAAYLHNAEQHFKTGMKLLYEHVDFKIWDAIDTGKQWINERF